MKSVFKNCKWEILIFAAAFFLYLPSVFFGYFPIDDDRFIQMNPHLPLALENIRFLMSKAYADLYTPLTFISLSIDHALSGSAWFYHLTNVLLFSITAVLFIVLQRKLGIRSWLAFVITLIWVLSPQRLESVVWISERKDVLCGFFAVISTLFMLYETEHKRVMWSSAIFLFLAMLAKPAASGLLAVPAAYAFFRFGYRKSFSLRQLPVYLFYAGYLILFHYAMQNVENPPPVAIPRALSIISHNILFYLSSAVFPLECSPIYPLVDWSNVLLIPVICVIVFAAGYALRLSRLFFPVLGVGAIWCGFFAATTGIVRFTYVDHADRYNYLPSIVLLIFFAFLAEQILTKYPEKRKAVLIFLLFATAWNLVFTSYIYPLWRDWQLFPYSVSSVCKNSAPNDTLLSLCGNIALSRRNADLCDNVALEFLKKSKKNFPEDTLLSTPARLNSALLFRMLGAYLRQDDKTALQIFSQLWRDPKKPPFFADDRCYKNIMALMIYDLLYRNGHVQNGARFLDSVIASGLQTKDSAYYFLLGMQAYNGGRFEEAILQWEQSLKLNPDDHNTKMNIEVLKKRVNKSQ